ncbi:MAG: hypothetical protein KJ970_15780 [Candidatus Eisenbacteria bacterium]|uniref:Uncharacterized protein n=1 Tax=Eiseniibacteriota bacterium TaxID=2212470 RepID=A0A948RZ98_UNCEI|nr:hypothetical protein [Candidatus Eisenbacteria bacterium]
MSHNIIKVILIISRQAGYLFLQLDFYLEWRMVDGVRRPKRPTKKHYVTF